MVSGNKQDSGKLSPGIIMSDSGIVINPCLSGILEIYDINGILIYKRALEDISDVGIAAWEELNISENGIYIARLITENGIESIKFIR